MNDIPGWKEQDNKLYRQFVFADFNQAFAFMTAVAAAAERANHHPDWKNSYNKVEIWLTSHDAKAVTSKDTTLASEINGLFSER